MELGQGAFALFEVQGRAASVFDRRDQRRPLRGAPDRRADHRAEDGSGVPDGHLPAASHLQHRSGLRRAHAPECDRSAHRRRRLELAAREDGWRAVSDSAVRCRGDVQLADETAGHRLPGVQGLDDDQPPAGQPRIHLVRVGLRDVSALAERREGLGRVRRRDRLLRALHVHGAGGDARSGVHRDQLREQGSGVVLLLSWPAPGPAHAELRVRRAGGRL